VFFSLHSPAVVRCTEKESDGVERWRSSVSAGSSGLYSAAEPVERAWLRGDAANAAADAAADAAARAASAGPRAEVFVAEDGAGTCVADWNVLGGPGRGWPWRRRSCWRAWRSVDEARNGSRYILRGLMMDGCAGVTHYSRELRSVQTRARTYLSKTSESTPGAWFVDEPSKFQSGTAGRGEG
jgi:hypothetical protein